MNMETTLNKKKQQLLSTAKELFIHYGIRRISIDEICRKSNVSKMTFYKHFENKTGLIKHVLAKDMNDGIRQVDAILEQKIPFTEKIKEIIVIKLKFVRQYSEEFTSELFALPELENFLRELNEQKLECSMRVFTIGQKEGVIRKDIKPEFYQFVLQSLTNMSKEGLLIRLYPGLEERFVELTNLALYGIIQR